MVPLRWLHWRHFVAMSRLKYPTKVDGTNGDSGTTGANDENDDPLDTMMIHWLYNIANGDIGTNVIAVSLICIDYFGFSNKD